MIIQADTGELFTPANLTDLFLGDSAPIIELRRCVLGIAAGDSSVMIWCPSGQPHVYSVGTLCETVLGALIVDSLWQSAFQTSGRN
jgi:hypothetical protein